MRKEFPTLFKVDNTNKVRRWEISVSDNPCGYTIRHGVDGGAIQETFTSVSVGKNLNKANSTNPYEQACLEAESKYNRQIDKGYAETVECANKLIKPVLAHNFDDYKHKIQWPAYAQKKYDGIRCLAVYAAGNVKLYSRLSKQFKSMVHIEKTLEPILSEEFILDGELYKHGDNNFQELISMIKRDSPSEKSGLIEYHVYDIFFPAQPTLTYQQRFERLQKILPKNHRIIKQVDTVVVNSEDELWKFHEKCTQEGYEGAMVRDMRGQYTPDKRSMMLLKVKKFIDAEFEIVGVVEGKGKSEGQAIFVCQTPEGKEFRVRCEGEDSLRRKYWRDRDKMIGKLLTVKFFSYSTDGVPRFPVGKGIRDGY